MGTGQISMPGNTAQMGYDYLGQMTSRKVTLTATPFRLNRSLFPMTVAKGVTYTNPLLGTIKSIYTDTGKPQEQDKPDGSTEAGEGGGVASK